jgi:flagellar motor switch protein FliM
LFKRTMTLNALSALSEGDTIKFPKAALEQIMLRLKGQMKGQWVIWGNQTDCTP